MPTVKEKKKSSKDDSKLLKKWSKSVVASGWTGIPNVLIENQQRLKLNSLQMNVLLILLKHWWDKDKFPFPSKKTIGEIVGREASTIQRQIRDLEGKGLIKRVVRMKVSGGQDSNLYELSGLVDKLKVLAKEKENRDKIREAEDARLRRGNQ